MNFSAGTHKKFPDVSRHSGRCCDCEAVLTSVAHSKFVLNELSPELVNMTKLYENKNVGPTEYKLKGMVRSYNKHLNCAVLIQGKWTYLDDLCSGVKEFSNLAALKKTV